MATVDLRIKTFIPHKEIFFWADQYYSYHFVGDNRSESFSSSSYRTYQRFVVDTSNFSFSGYRYMGETVMNMYSNRDGKLVGQDRDTAPISGLTYSSEVKNGYLYIYAVCDAGNPIVPSPNINYEFTLRVSKDGSVRLTGKHDGFPAYEVWRKIGSNTESLIWSHDPRKTGEGISSLGWPMEPVTVFGTDPFLFSTTFNFF